MAPNFKEAESATENDNLLRNERFYEDSESYKLKTSKRSGGPDGCRAWTIAFANFLINFLVVGLGRMSGILYVVFMHMFHVDRQTASMPFSIQQAARNFFGPLAGILGQKYGVRSVTVVGGVIGMSSAMLCYFAMNMTWITILWGLVFGICTALTTTLNQVPIDEWFEKFKTTAGGFAFSGGCVAAFIFPVLLEYFISHYGMDKTFLIMGVFLFFVIPASLILIKPPWKRDKKLAIILEEEEMRNKSYTPVSYNTFQHSITNNVVRKAKKPINFEFLKKYSEFVYQLFILTIPDDVISSETFSETLWHCSDTLPLVNDLEELYNYLKTSSTQKITFEAHKEDLTQSVHLVEVTINGFPKQNSTDYNIEKNDHVNAPISQVYETYADNAKWLFLSTKLQDLCKIKEKALLIYFPSNVHIEILKILDLLKTLNDLITESENVVIEQNIIPIPNDTDELSECRKLLNEHAAAQSNSILEHIKTAIRLHGNPLFLLICLCRGVFMLTFIPLVTIIVDFSMDKGLKQSTGKYVIAILSLGDLLGRLCLGWINDVGILSLPKYMLVVMLLLAISTATLPMMHSEVSLMPAILIFGMLQGSLFIRHQVLVSTYMDPREQAIGMGFINLLSGFIGFALPFYIGYFRDSQGSYDNMFYLNGAICAIIGLLWMFEPFLVRVSPKEKNKK